MKNKELFTFIHGAACGAGNDFVSSKPSGEDPQEDLCFTMGLQNFGGFVETLRCFFKGADYVSHPDNLDNFESIPAATDWIWKNRYALDMWKTDMKDEVSE